MRDIPEYEGLYAITSCGRVFSYRKQRFLKPGDNGHGYKFIYLYKDGKKSRYYIHRLVSEVYLPNPDNLPQVNHLDEDKANNALPNLEWCDAAYNINYSQAKKVQCIETQEIFDSIKEASKAVGVDSSSIIKACKGKRKTAGGYHWAYYEQKEEM